MSMTLLTALLLGGGFYAYRVGIGPSEAERTEANGKVEAPGIQDSTANAGPGGVQGRSSNEGEGNVGGQQAETGETGKNSADTRGDQGAQGPGEGSVAEANTINEAGPSQNQAQGRVGDDEAQAQSATTAASGDAADGKVLFEANCQGCHGSNAKGVVGPALVGKDRPAQWPYSAFRRALIEGINIENKQLNATMPRYGQTALQPKGSPASDKDIADLQAYLKTLPQN